MLIDFKYLFEKYKVSARGVIHIGANTGQEADAYKDNGIVRVIWVEAILEVYKKLVEHVSDPKYGDTICINACISDVDGKEIVFHESNNESQSSSFLELGTHAEVHPDVKYVRDIKCYTRRITSLFRELSIDINDYTFLNIDLQGAEMYALRGMVQLLDSVNYAYLEVNKAELYKGCALIEEIDSFMGLFDFVRVETLWAGNTNWGDAFYVKKNLL